jgi:hypothetical protein
MSVAVLVAGIVALGGAVLAATLLPSRPGQVAPRRTSGLGEAA